MEKERPIVVTILAAILFFVGSLDILLSLRFGASSWVLGYGLIAIALSLGLWFLLSWAWYGTILLQLFAVGYAFYDWFANGMIDFLAIFLGLFIILYMLRQPTKALFLLSNRPAKS